MHRVVDQMRNQMADYYFRTLRKVPFPNSRDSICRRFSRYNPCSRLSFCPAKLVLHRARMYSLLKHSFQIRKGTAEHKGFHDGKEKSFTQVLLNLTMILNNMYFIIATTLIWVKL